MKCPQSITMILVSKEEIFHKNGDMDLGKRKKKKILMYTPQLELPAVAPLKSFRNITTPGKIGFFQSQEDLTSSTSKTN